MNKLELIFTALRVYRQARSEETSTLRGLIIGSLAAATIVGLWYMGADMSAEQIGLVLAAITGFDSILKIVLPDKIGDKNGGSSVPALPPIALQGRSESNNAALGTGAMQPADELCHPVPTDRRPGPTGTADPNTYPRFCSGFGDRD